MLQGSLVTGGVASGAIYLYEGDHLKSFDGLYFASGLEITLPEDSQIPAVEIELDGKQDVVLCSVTFPSLVTLSGSSIEFDRAVVVADVSLDGRLDFCRLTCTNPPGGSLSSLDISSQSVVYQKTQLSSTGQMHFAYTPSSTPHRFECVIGPDGGGVSSSRSPLERLEIGGDDPAPRDALSERLARADAGDGRGRIPALRCHRQQLVLARGRRGLAHHDRAEQ
jgi:hypothetical protein